MSGFQRAARRRLFATALGLTLGAAAAASAQTPSAADQASDVVDVDQLVVTASAFERKIVDAPASISVISREALQTKRFSSLAEALADVEGVDVGDGVGKTGGLNISIRGMPSDYTLVLVDGRRQNAAGNVTPNGFGETSTSFMPAVASIERIEVIRGPMSTLYGSDAMGGVINIITRKVGKQWHGSASVESTFQQHDEYGDGRGTNLYLSGPLVEDRLGLTLRGNYIERDESNIRYSDVDNNEITPWMGRNPVESDIYNAGGRLTFTPNADHDVSLDYEVGKQRYDNSEGQLGTLGNQGYSDEQRYEREQYYVAHTGRFAFGTLESSLTRNTTETIGRIIPVPAGEPLRDRTLETENTIFDTKFITHLGNHAVTIGRPVH